MIEPLGSKIEIYPDGRVVKISLKYVRGSQPVIRETDLTTLESEMAMVKKCAAELYRRDFEPRREPCEGGDDVEIQYKSLYAEKEFALRSCGQLQTLKGKCAKSMIELLDSLEKRSLN